MERQKFFSRVANQTLQTVLHSPLHSLADSRSTIITVTGRKTGKLYVVPVNYWRQGDVVRIISRRNRTWWRNLRGGVSVTLCLDGKDVKV